MRKPRKAVFGSAVFGSAVAVPLIFAASAAAAAGDLDPSFSGDGKGTYNAGVSTVSYDERATDTVVQPDGKVLVSMGQFENAGGGPVVARLTTGGLLDTTFGGDGVASLGFQGQINSIELQADGKILVGGTRPISPSTSDGIVARLNPDGTPDTGYSVDGLAEIDLAGASDSVLDLAVAGDGDAVASGQTFSMGPPSPIVVRLQAADGAPDVGFGGGDGIATPAGLSSAQHAPVAIQGTSVLVAGLNMGTFVVARLDSSGALDTAFDTDGLAPVSFGAGVTPMGPSAHGLAVQDTGEIVVGATVLVSGNQDFGVARLTAVGAPDLSFSSDGAATTPFGATETLSAVGIQANDTVVASGFTGSTGFSEDADFAVSRYEADGDPDNTFDTDGKLTTDFGAGDRMLGFAIDPGPLPGDASDDKLIGAGHTNESFGAPADLAVARYTGTAGALDTGFDGDGRAEINQQVTRNSLEGVEAMAVQPDGKVLLGGATDLPNGGSDFLIARVNSDGSLDSSFSGDGFAIVDFGQSEFLNGIAVQPDGKIVAGGGTFTGSGTQDWALVRLTSTGTPDSGFDGDGRRTLDTSATSSDSVEDLVVQADGKIVAVGEGAAPASDSKRDTAVARFNDNGSLDSAFDGDGISYLTLAGNDVVPTSVALQPTDGKIVVAGGGGSAGPTSFMAARIDDADGAPDAGFAGDGIAIEDIGPGGGQAYDVAIDSGGGVVLAGFDSNGPTADVALARLDGSTGAPAGLDGDGVVITDTGGSDDFIRGVAIQADGKIVTAGKSGDEFAINRFTTAGALDTSFSGDGKMLTNFGGPSELATAVEILPNGRIAAGGDTGTGDFGAVRVFSADQPAAPTVTATSPASGADDNNPEVTGAAPAGTTVRIYTNPSCSGVDVGSGSEAAFGGPGITVFVPDDTTSTFYATATDSNETSACSAAGLVYQEVTPGPADQASGGASPGGSVSTNSVVTPTDPVGTEVTTPSGGAVTITEQATGTPAPSGFSLLGQQVEITAPAETAANPLVLVFHVDASLLPGGVDETNLQVFRNGAVVADCAPGSGTSATPDPCVAGRANAGGDITLTVRTSQASSWNFGVATPPPTGGGGTTTVPQNPVVPQTPAPAAKKKAKKKKKKKKKKGKK